MPLAICQRVAQDQFFDEFQLFVYLKSICDGHLRISKHVIKSAAYTLECHPKTIKRRLERLKQRNWIGTFKSGVNILRGFNALFGVENMVPFRTGVVFEVKYLNLAKAFVVSGCIGYMAKYQWIKERRRLREGEKILAPHHPAVTLLPAHPVACRFIVGELGVSISTASEWKHLGEKAGFIKVEKRYTPAQIDRVKEYKRLELNDAHKIVFWEGQYCFQEPDVITPLLNFKTRSKFDRKVFRPLIAKSGQTPKHNNLGKGLLLEMMSLRMFEQLMAKRHNK